MKTTLALIVAATASLHMATANAYVSRSNGINWDKNGMAVCKYGQLKSCATAAYQGDRGAAQYLNQRIQNNPNPNKTTFYNYSPPSNVKVTTPTRPTCSAAMQKLYGSDCR